MTIYIMDKDEIPTELQTVLDIDLYVFGVAYVEKIYENGKTKYRRIYPLDIITVKDKYGE